MEGFLVTKEIGDPDQQLFEQQVQFRGPLPEELRIPRDITELVDVHPPFDAPEQRILLIEGEIVPGVRAQHDQYLRHGGADGAAVGLTPIRLLGCVSHVADQLTRKIFGRCDIVHQAGPDRILRHTVVLGRH
jgi:hypothetical protein